MVYRSTDQCSAVLHALMPRTKFEQILSNWRYKDFTILSKAQMNQLKQEDPFWAVTDFLEDINESFGSNWNPAQCLDIDEQCCPWKGRHKCRCYNPKKPEKWHFKIYALNCSKSGYLVHFKIYRGKGEVRPEGVSPNSCTTGTAKVPSLLGPCPIHRELVYIITICTDL